MKNGFIHIEGKGPCQPENGQEKHCITFYHYNLKYEGQIVLETTTRDRKALRYYKLRMRNNGIRYIRAIDRFKRSQDSREVGSINLVQSEIQIRWFITNSMYLFISGLDITFFPTMISSTWSG